MPTPWMAFVDGENLTIRGQEVAQNSSVPLMPGPYYRQNAFVWLPGINGKYPLICLTVRELTGYPALRASYYTSVQGDEPLVNEVRLQLWRLGFDAHVYKKSRPEQKAKGIDIALTKDMLSHAFLGNYPAAVLMAGDGDYVPLVEEVKRLGKLVYVCFFSNGLSPELKLACDGFCDITESFLANWRSCDRLPASPDPSRS